MDLLLIALTLALAVVGTVWRDPPVWAKVTLIALLLISSALSAVKSVADNRDKELLQTLAIAGLALPNSAYDKVYQQLSGAFGENAYQRCHHTTEGMTCVQDANTSGPAMTLVLNRYEVAQVYADAVRGKETKSFLTGISSKRYDPKQLSDDYEDKLGILGYDTFYDMCGSFPSDYNYDDNFGVNLLYDDGGTRKRIQITRDEMIGPTPAAGPVIFRQFEQLYRSKIAAALPNCNKSN